MARHLSSRQKLRVMREADKRYGESIRTMTRAEYNDVLRTIASELYPLTITDKDA